MTEINRICSNFSNTFFTNWTFFYYTYYTIMIYPSQTMYVFLMLHNKLQSWYFLHPTSEAKETNCWDSLQLLCSGGQFISWEPNLLFQYYSLLPLSCFCNTLCPHLCPHTVITQLKYITHSLSVYICINNNKLLPYNSFSDAFLFTFLIQKQSWVFKSDILLLK